MDTNSADILLANQVALGRHQHLIEATNEEGEVGKFIVHRPNVREEVLISVEYSRLKTPANELAPVEIDLAPDNLAFAIATLNVIIDQRPPWFPRDAGECLDGALLYHVFAQYCTWRDSFRRPVSGSQDSAG